MPSAQFHDLLTLLNARGLNEQLGVHLLRKGFERIARLFNDAGDAQCSEVTCNGVTCDWLVPADAREHAILLFLHGGGYIMGSRNTHRGLAARMGRAANMHVLVPEYRLAPEHPYPASLEDALSVYQWILEQGIDPRLFVVAGDSAGGGLALGLLMKARDLSLPMPAAGVLLSPWTDLSAQGASVHQHSVVDPLLSERLLVRAAAAYLGEGRTADAYASPILGDFTDLPPLLIHVGGREVLLSDATTAAEKAQASGVEVTLDVWDEMTHVWHYFAALAPEGQEAIDRIGAFVRDHVK